LRVRVAIFLCAVLTGLIVVYTLYKGVNTLNRLSVVEADRDQWQKPETIIAALQLRDDSVVADIGSGAGYFALKLSRRVSRGRVYALDSQRLPLSFLWIRALLGSLHNISIRNADAAAPGLPPHSLDAVLIANTYHEFSHPDEILDQLHKSMKAGGRLVVVDHTHARSSRESHDENEHQVEADAVEAGLRRQGFQIVDRRNLFVHPESGDAWWLLAAISRSPAPLAP